MGNQLRAHLLVSFPAAAGLFCKLHSTTSLAFLARFDCQDRVGWLSEKRLAGWLKAAGYSGRTSPAELYRRLSSAPRGAAGEQGAASAQVTRALAAVLASLNTQIKTLEADIAAQLASHADGHIFTSLPRSGTVRAARLLAEIGDCRTRFPDPQALICLAGAAPSTRQSGKHKAVTFRWAVSKQLRDAVCDFADGSRHASPWAAHIYNAAIARGKDHPLGDTHPGPSMALCDLGMLAQRRRLRPRPPPRPAATARRSRHRYRPGCVSSTNLLPARIQLGG